MSSSTFKCVQALRGLAALSVMLFHFRWNINAISPGFGDSLFGWGASGVDLFFIISGFVITLSAQKIPQSFSGAVTFLKKRALRIFPAYYLILIITFLLGGAMSTFHYADKTANLISALTFMPIDAAHAPFYVDDGGMYGIRWTLNYEVYFYLVVGVMLMFPLRWLSVSAFFTATLVLVPVLSGKAFSLSPDGYHFDSALLGLVTNPIILLFISGALLAGLTPWLVKANGTLMSLAFGLSLLMTIYFFSQRQFSVHGLTSSGWLYLLLMATAIGAEKTLGKFVPTLLISLGNISFSLYLIHTLMNTGLGKRFASLGIEDGYARLILSVVLSLALAWLSWRFIEQPFVSRRPKKEALKTKCAAESLE